MKKKCNVLVALIVLSAMAPLNLKAGDTASRKHHFEVSFGQSILYISNSRTANLRNQASIIVPTNSALFFVEYRPDKRVRVPIFLNLATESKQYLVNGQLINERASPTFGGGAQFRVFRKKIDEKSKIEVEIGPLMSVIFDKKNRVRVAPILAGRVCLLRGEYFVMYAGCSYSLGINALGLIYGTGSRF